MIAVKQDIFGGAPEVKERQKKSFGIIRTSVVLSCALFC